MYWSLSIAKHQHSNMCERRRKKCKSIRNSWFGENNVSTNENNYWARTSKRAITEKKNHLVFYWISHSTFILTDINAIHSPSFQQLKYHFLFSFLLHHNSIIFYFKLLILVFSDWIQHRLNVQLSMRPTHRKWWRLNSWQMCAAP